MTPLIRLHCVALLSLVPVGLTVAMCRAYFHTANGWDLAMLGLCAGIVALVDHAWRMESVR